MDIALSGLSTCLFCQLHSLSHPVTFALILRGLILGEAVWVGIKHRGIVMMVESCLVTGHHDGKLNEMLEESEVGPLTRK